MKTSVSAKPAVLFLLAILTAFLPALPLFCMSVPAGQAQSTGSDPFDQSLSLHILSTSDIHCRYLPYDYSKNKPDQEGSMSRLSSIVTRIRSEYENTVLIDVGDAIQGSLSQPYLTMQEHPFATAANYMDYDALVLGNHEFNFGTAALENVMVQCEAPVLCGNVYKSDGSRLAQPWTIIRKNGIRIGIIGMVTPTTSLFAAESMDGCTVTDPLEETKKAVSFLRDRCDVLIAAEHMGLEEEYGIYGSGAEDIAQACPQLDVILAAHAHTRVREKFVNGVLITENRKLGKTLSDITLSLARRKDGTYAVLGKKAKSIDADTADPDEDFLREFEDVRILSDRENERVLGTLTDLALSPDPGKEHMLLTYQNISAQDQTSNSPAEGPLAAHAAVHDNADPEPSCFSRTSSPDVTLDFDDSIPLSGRGQSSLSDFINSVQLYYTDAEISATALPDNDKGLRPGPIRTMDLKDIYPDDYTIYVLGMTGRQLRTYMEWCASYYEVSEENKKTLKIQRASGRKESDCDTFSGISYQIDLSLPCGNRIRNLTWPDGNEIHDEDMVRIVVNRVRAKDLVESDRIFMKGKPHAQIIQADVNGKYSGLREMIGSYISEGQYGCRRSCGWKGSGYRPYAVLDSLPFHPAYDFLLQFSAIL